MFRARFLCYLIRIDSITIETRSNPALAACPHPAPFGLDHRQRRGRPRGPRGRNLLAPSPGSVRTVYAIAARAVPRCVGLRVARTKGPGLTFDGFCSALAGWCSPSTCCRLRLHAQGMELDAIAAVVIVGRCSPAARGYVVGNHCSASLIYGTIRPSLSFSRATSARGAIS